MENVTIGVVLGAAMKAVFSAVFKQASGEVNTLGQALNNLKAQRADVGRAMAAQDGLARTIADFSGAGQSYSSVDRYQDIVREPAPDHRRCAVPVGRVALRSR